MIEHKSAVEAVFALLSMEQVKPETRVLQFANYTFDVSISDIFITLSTGACLCIASKEAMMNNLAAVCKKMKVSFARLTPTVVKLLQPEDVPSLKTLVLNGERAPDELVEKWKQNICTVIRYGATEIATACIEREVQLNGSSNGNVIGKPLGSTRAYILNENLTTTPMYCVGELFLTGSQLARGYYEDTERTAELFLPNPFFEKGNDTSERIYRTGDLFRRHWDGNFEYVGRKTNSMIKLHGLRIELDFVEKIVTKSSIIAGACIGIMERRRSEYLTAWIVPKVEPKLEMRLISWKETKPSKDQITSIQQSILDLKNFLATQLPTYMVPTCWIPVGIIPLNQSCKADRRLLRHFSEELSDEEINSYVTAITDEDNTSLFSNEKEEFLASVWAEMFNISSNSISRYDSFFGLGGDSIKAITLVQTLRNHQFDITVVEILQNPVLYNMANTLRSGYNVPENSHIDLTYFADEQLLETLKNQLNDHNIPVEDVEQVYMTSPLQESLGAVRILRHHFFGHF